MKVNNRTSRVRRYFRKTWKQKLLALVVLSIGVVHTKVTRDATILVLMILIAVPMFIDDDNWF